MTQFLYRVGTSKLFSSFSVYFNSALYGTVYFVKGPIKTEPNVLVFDWLTSELLIILLWSATYNCPSKQIYIYICVCVCVYKQLNNIYIYIYIYIYKHYKWNAVKLSRAAVVCRVLQNRCSLKFCNKHRKTPALKSLFNNVVGLQAIRRATILKSGSDTGVSLCILQSFYEQLFA